MNDWIDVCNDHDVQKYAKKLDMFRKVMFYLTCILAFFGELLITQHYKEQSGLYGAWYLVVLLALYWYIVIALEYVKGAMCAKIWFENHNHAMIERRFDKVVEVPRFNYFTYKGAVGTTNLLYSIKDQLVGDVYLVTSDDAEYYWDAHDWKDIKEHLHVPREEQNKSIYRNITELDGDWKGPRG